MEFNHVNFGCNYSEPLIETNSFCSKQRNLIFYFSLFVLDFLIEPSAQFKMIDKNSADEIN